MPRRFLIALSVFALAVGVLPATAAAGDGRAGKLQKIDHIVVIYEENHSFDNLYGSWEGVNGLANADTAHTTQVDQSAATYDCLKQDDVNLTSPPLSVTCTDTAHGFTSHFPNTWFTIDDYIPATATTCPPAQQAFAKANGWTDGTGLAGGCTRDLVHEFYQEQYQLDGGKQNRYMSGSDAIGLTMGTYDTHLLPIYQYLHAAGHPRYAIADDFFQAAFGGSFLNHQWLIAAATPVFPEMTAGSTLHSIVDANGMPTSYALYTATSAVRRGPLTVACDAAIPGPNGVCGDWAVNTMRPPFQPYGVFGAQLAHPQTAPTIGDRLTAKGIDWAWYSGGWSNANGDVNGPGWTNGDHSTGTGSGCPDPDTINPGANWPICPNAVFQFHHQPFNYFEAFDPTTATGAANRAAHLRDEVEFMSLASDSTKTCDLKPVSFVKPLGQENEHPGYASEPNGSDHLVDLLKSIEDGACAKDTMVVVTYDEFGGQWDHVPPPGQGSTTAGPHDVWGPGTRIPAVVISPFLTGSFVVDSTEHDTTSILATIEHRFDLDPLGTRDAAVQDLTTVFSARAVPGG